MLSSQANNADIMKMALPTVRGAKPLLTEQQQVAREPVAQQQSAIKWMVETENGAVKLKPLANTSQVDVTTVSIYQDEVEAPTALKFMGQRIDISVKVAEFKENYVKNYTLTKSHNLMVARFAEFKTAFFGYLLSLCGVASEDIKKLRDKALQDGIHQNKMLFEENEYNGELLSIVGGGGKKAMRAQQKVISEIRNQLIAQAKNLGLPSYYSQERILDIQITQCQRIVQKFGEEKVNLEYQLAYLGVQKAVN
ncbi:hypothetical protein HZC35_04430 [Candidatus Saganbacteria bacterium]|nr:hypothetical protein [Candidatus Saganbacteria bacterium]